MFNFKNKDNFRKFVKYTSNKKELETCFDNENEDIEYSSKHWMKILKNILHISFKKIRLRRKKINGKMKKLMKKKEILKGNLSKAKVSKNAVEVLRVETQLKM